MSESGRSCVFASLGDNGSEKSERKQMEKNKAEISRKSLKSEEKRRASQMADTEALLEFNKIKEIWKELALTEWAREPGQPHKKYPSWNKNSLMDIFKWFLQFSEKSIPAHTLNDRCTAYSFFYKSFSSFYQIVYPISLGYNKSF